MPRGRQQEHRPVTCDVIGPAEELRDRVDHDRHTNLLPLRARDLDMFAQDPIVLRVRLPETTPLVRTDQESCLRDVSDASNMIEVEVRNNCRLNVPGVEARGLDPSTQRVFRADVQLKDPPE